MYTQKMYILRRIFRLLVVCGCWRPRSWSSPFKKFLYTAYTIILLLLIYTVTFCQFMDILVNVRTQDEFSDNFYMLLAMLVSCQKVYSLLTIRGKIALFTRILGREPFLPGNEEEEMIRTRFDKKAESNTLFYALLVESSVLLMVTWIGLVKIESRMLPMRMWLPYNYSSVSSYSLTYIQQTLALTFGSLMHVACDSLLCGLLIHTRSQLEILGCRLKAIKRSVDGNRAVKSCLRYHDRVYRFAGMINREFGMVILVQFAMSTLVVCFNLYQFAKIRGLSSRMVYVLMYTCCMLTQIFIYCWYGNELKQKSLEISNVIFGTDWTQLDINARRFILMIMKRATEPIEITSAHVVSMNLESFLHLLKAAYSAYNVLQQGEQ